jgi:hypothetical protein
VNRDDGATQVPREVLELSSVGGGKIMTPNCAGKGKETEKETVFEMRKGRKRRNEDPSGGSPLTLITGSLFLLGPNKPPHQDLAFYVLVNLTSSTIERQSRS